ncbi:MAG: hypothetical protein ACI9DC_001806 [Gammaproteobacteria bacterium]|jgi:uncharacterized protein YheU (UPF0270 family)
MSAIQIPQDTISTDALDGLIEEFVTRDGTDYGFEERSLREKKSAVMTQISRGDAVIVFDSDTETCNIVLKTEVAGL